MATRRGFLAGILAAGLYPVPSWADAGSPSFLSAARKPDGSYALFGLSEHGQPIFEIDLPDRGHAAAAHPEQPIAVAFARRPGTFAIVLDCKNGKEVQRFSAPKGRHFYGHGAFSADGALLFTGENDFENAEGIIGVWDVARGFTRIGEFSSGGIGPHDVQLMPDGASLVIANGGIETHPDSGRLKLNIPTMQPNLSYASLSGQILETTELPAASRLASIRHLAVRDDGLVAIGCQWQGDHSTRPLVMTHRRGAPMAPVEQSASAQLDGYVGSIAFSKDGQDILATSPRGGIALLHRLSTNNTIELSLEDVCGAAPAESGLALTTGNGDFWELNDKSRSLGTNQPLAWDNHLIALKS